LQASDKFEAGDRVLGCIYSVGRRASDVAGCPLLSLHPSPILPAVVYRATAGCDRVMQQTALAL